MIFEIKINTLTELSNLSKAYLEGELKLNISKIARELKCDKKLLKTISMVTFQKIQEIELNT